VGSCFAPWGDLHHAGIVVVFIGAAFGLNCVSSLKHHLDASKTVGVTQEEATEVAKLAVFVKQKAASHVERIFEFNED